MLVTMNGSHYQKERLLRESLLWQIAQITALDILVLGFSATETLLPLLNPLLPEEAARLRGDVLFGGMVQKL